MGLVHSLSYINPGPTRVQYPVEVHLCHAMAGVQVWPAKNGHRLGLVGVMDQALAEEEWDWWEKQWVLGLPQ